ncbi:MAG: hypothetical protein ACLGIF_00400, partial [Actinomycetes bacterium]
DRIEYRWMFTGMQANNCPSAVGGSSGSPLLDDRDQLVGLVTTTTAGAPPGGDCYLGVPCERTTTGVRTVRPRSYGVSAAGLRDCFEGGRFTLRGECPLPRPGLTLQLGRAVYRSAELADLGSIPVPLVATRATPVRAGVTAARRARVCPDPGPNTDAAVAEPGGGTPYGVRLPPRPGIYLLCVAEDGRWDGAATGVFEVDDTPPVRTPALAVAADERGYRVEPVLSPPELVDYRVKAGPAASTDCDRSDGYTPFARMPFQVSVGTLPARVCVIGFDLAGNPATPWSQELPPP